MTIRAYPIRSALLLVCTALLLALAAPGSASAGKVRLQEECPGCGGPGGLVLVWEGEPGENNDITVTRGADGFTRVTERGIGARLVADSPNCTVSILRVAECGPNNTYFIFLYGHDGDDLLSTDALSEPDGDRFSDWIFGGAGDDTLDGGDLECCHGSRLTPGPGDDVIRGGSGGHDAVLYNDRTEGVDVSLAARPAGARNGVAGEADVIGEDVDDLWGSDHDDVLRGDEDENHLWTEEGNDVVYGGGGDDVFWGYAWARGTGDTLYGEEGDDRIYPGPSFGTIYGGPGTDSVRVDNHAPAWFLQLSLDGNANDGGIVNEDLYDAPSVPTGQLLEVENLRGNRVNDLLIGDDGPNEFEADEGSDVIVAGGGADHVDADWGAIDPGGDDFVMVLDGVIDTVRCGGGVDVVVADPNDALDSDCEQTVFEQIPIPDLTIPGLEWPPRPPDVELPSVELPPIDLPQLPQPTPGTGGELVSAANPLDPPACHAGAGTAGADCLIGGKRADRLSGGKGGDRVSGEGGDDRLSGGSGDDWLDGGRGADRLSGEKGNDLLLGGSGSDTLLGGAGRDGLVAADGRLDKVDCGAGSDVAIVDRVDRVRGCEKVKRAKPARR